MRERHSARLILFDPEQRVLLFEVDDPTSYNPRFPDGGPFWIAPGGGVEPGETIEAAAHRELWEETGITGAELSPIVGVFEADLVWAGVEYHIVNHIFVATVEQPAVMFDGMSIAERSVVLGHRWWALQDLHTERIDVRPPGLVELMGKLVR